MKLTKRNHYNPCLWTAFWNRDYYEAVLRGTSDDLTARDQDVYTLNVRADSIYSTNVNNVHFEKNFGVAKITQEAAKKFCKRHYPDQYEQFCRESKAAAYPVYIDFEQILEALEKTPAYQILPTVIKRQAIISAEEKAFLADFVFLQWLRNHATMNLMLESNADLGIDKFDFFITLKNWLSDPDASYSPIACIGLSLWTLYRTDKETFPLTDSPVLVNPDSIMIALSPKLLLEISPKIRSTDAIWKTKDHLDEAKLTEFRQRTIKNTFREIIFGDRETLEQWQSTQEFRQRVDAVKSKKYKRLTAEKTKNELWLINTLGNY